MKKNVNCYVYLVTLFGLTIFLAEPAFSGEVTLTPAHENKIIIAKLGDVVNVSASGGGTVSMSVDCTNEASISGSGLSKNVTFGPSTEGKKSTITVTISHVKGEETCTSEKSFTYDVYVPKIENAADIWFWNGVNRTTTYKNKATLTVIGVPPGKTFTWDIKGEADVVNFSNNQETISGSSTTQEIHTVGYSATESNLWLELKYGSKLVASTSSEKFTSRTTTQMALEGVERDASVFPWSTVYIMRVKDKFGMNVTEIDGAETFSPEDFVNASGCNWTDSNSTDGFTTGPIGKIGDTYEPDVSYSGGIGPEHQTNVPTIVKYGEAGTSTKTVHTNQAYVFGAQDGSGQVAHEHKLQYYRGKAQQE